MIVWNGNDYEKEQDREIIPTSEWNHALLALKQIRKVHFPRVLILSCVAYRRWGCTPQWALKIRYGHLQLRNEDFLVLPMQILVGDLLPHCYMGDRFHSRKNEAVLDAWEREFQRIAQIATFHCVMPDYGEFLHKHSRYVIKPFVSDEDRIDEIAKRPKSVAGLPPRPDGYSTQGGVASSGSTGAGPSAGPSQTEAGETDANIPSFPPEYAHWIFNSPKDQRSVWIDYLTGLLGAMVEYLHPDFGGESIDDTAAGIKKMCVKVADLRGEFGLMDRYIIPMEIDD